MEKITSFKNIPDLRLILIFSYLLFIISSCNPTKYVPQEETLLENSIININNEGIKKSEIIPYIKQNPNKRIFGTRFYLGLYNLSNINKEKWPHSWLRNIGEEPVIYDSYSTITSVEQIKSYISSRGYFDSKVSDTTETDDRKTEVFYKVDLLPPYLIRNLYYEISDSTIETLFYFDSVNCMIERGKPYDVEVLQAERSRFERFIKDMGFYSFSSEHINFRIDSTIGNRQVDIYYGIKDFLILDQADNPVLVPHPLYRIRNIYIYPDYIPRDALQGGEEYLGSLDTINYRDYYFVTREESPAIKYDLIISSLYLRPGSTFNVTNTERSQSHLLSLRNYRLVNISYNDTPENNYFENSELVLDCNIQLTLLSQQSFKIELEGTNTAGYMGGALNLVYQHKNIFHGAELLNLKLKGAYEAMRPTTDSRLRSAQEYGAETSLRFPKFLLPVLNTESFVKKYNPTTTLLFAYNYQNLPAYTRTMANATFGYNWKAGNYVEHIVNPLQLNIIKLPPGSIDSAFARKIEASPFLSNAWKDIMILGGNYSFIYNNQEIKKSRDYWFLRINAEASGNLPSVISKISGKGKEDGSYNYFGQPFAQYVRVDMDVRYNVILNDVSSIVYRGFIGAGIPYGNSSAIPFEKQYFGGGANGIRAWQVRSLGPGSYVPDSVTFLNQTADIKLEANVEYRFKLFWILEGALFVDAGNIWSIKYDNSQPGSQFQFKNFYNDIAIGTGTGFRFDFKFVIGRLDLGMKLRDPGIQEGSKWIIGKRPYDWRDFALVIGIGYPF